MDPIKFIAARITSDPDVLNEEHGLYYADEVAIPLNLLPPELRGEKTQTPRVDIPAGSGYEGLPDEDEFSSEGIFGINFEYEWTYHAGERRTRDYPGSPAYASIDNVWVKEIDGPNGPIPLTPELKKWAEEWFWENEDDIREQNADYVHDYDPEDYRDYDRDYDDF